VARDKLDVEYLGRLTIVRGEAAVLRGAPSGTRLIAGLVGGRLDGPRVRATVAQAPGGDWATRRADGSLRIDARLLLLTDDGAHILMTYLGVGARRDEAFEIRTAPLFETGDERYTWLNSVQAAGYGEITEDGVVYELYALK
jgi:hypothetical protein